MLCRLIYVSRARAFRSDDVASILVQSRENNPAANVTGGLCLLDGVYMQYLEGPEAALQGLFGRILDDDRNHAVRLLDQGAIGTRLFPQWSMALLAWDERIRTLLMSHGMAAPLDLYAVPPDEAPALFRALARMPNWVAL